LDRHVIIIPTYNQRESIVLLVEEILDLGLGSQVIVIDDNSPDGTGELGLGTAYIATMKAALVRGIDHILTMDVSFSRHPHYVPNMLTAFELFDVIVGPRYMSGKDPLLHRAAQDIDSSGQPLKSHGAESAGGRCHHRLLEPLPGRPGPDHYGSNHIGRLLIPHRDTLRLPAARLVQRCALLPDSCSSQCPQCCIG
jgi:hypothetical protein